MPERHVPVVHASVVAADKLGRVSPQWMRHTDATHALARGQN
jgi:hypothetical protein